MILPILYTVTTLDTACFSMVIAVTNLFVSSQGGTQFFLGVLFSASAFIALVWTPVAGSLSDVLGRKKVLLRCLLVCVVGNLIVMVSPTLPAFFIGRIICVFGCPIMTLVKSLLDDHVSSPEAKKSALGTMQAFGSVGFIVGALVSGRLSEYENGFSYIFGLMSATILFNYVLITLIPEVQKKPKKSASDVSIVQQITSALTKLSTINWPKYWDLFVIKFTIDFSLSVFQFNGGAILMQRFGVGGKTFSYILAGNSIVAICSALTLKKFKDKLYSKDDSGLGRLFHCNVLLIIAFLGGALSTNFGVYVLSNLPMTVVRILTESTFTEVLLARASPTEKGSILGAFESTLSLGGLTAPLVSAVISEAWGISASVLLCCVPLALSAVLTRTQKTKVA